MSRLHSVSIVSWVVLILVASSPVAAGGEEPLRVDCDVVDDLGTRLDKAVAAGFDTVLLRGTCVANLEIRAPRLRLVGDPTAVIQSFDPDTGELPVAVRAVGRVDLVLENLEIRGASIGVWADGPGTIVQVVDSVVSDNLVGARAERGAEVDVRRSTLRNNGQGVIADAGGRIVLQEASIEENETGVVVNDGSTLFAIQSEIQSNGFIGLQVRQLSSADLSNSRLRDNGPSGVSVFDRSRLDLRFDSDIGAPGEPSVVSVSDSSQIRFASSSDVWGDVTSRSSKVRVAGAILHGSLLLERFSDGIVEFVFGSSDAVVGGIVCQTGSDAFCNSASAQSSGCPGATETCTR